VLRAQEKSVPSFTLEDQFAQAHEIRFPTTNVVVIAVADRKGSAQVDAWTAALVKRYGRSIQLAGIADMSKVPALLRPLVRKRFAQDRRVPIMMDWDGKLTRLLDCQNEQANIVVLSSDGREVYRCAGEARPAALDALCSAINAARRGPDQTAP
jgi:hypothetical protein